jgi:hypothetical protein
LFRLRPSPPPPARSAKEAVIFSLDADIAIILCPFHFRCLCHALMRSAARRSERNARARQHAVPRAACAICRGAMMSAHDFARRAIIFAFRRRRLPIIAAATHFTPPLMPLIFA